MAQRDRSRICAAGKLSASKRQNRERDKWRKQRDVHPHRAFADRAHSQNVPRRAHRNHRKSENQSAMPRDEPRHELPDVVDAQIWIQRHFKHAARQRQPRFLKSPEAAHPSTHPNIKAALFGDRRREFAYHHGGRQAPQQWGKDQDEQRRRVTRFLDDVLQAIRTARNHEVGCRDHGQHGNFRGSFQAAAIFNFTENLHRDGNREGFGGAGFSLWGLVFARPKTHRLKPAPRKPLPGAP